MVWERERGWLQRELGRDGGNNGRTGDDDRGWVEFEGALLSNQRRSGFGSP